MVTNCFLTMFDWVLPNFRPTPNKVKDKSKNKIEVQGDIRGCPFCTTMVRSKPDSSSPQTKGQTPAGGLLTTTQTPPITQDGMKMKMERSYNTLCVFDYDAKLAPKMVSHQAFSTDISSSPPDIFITNENGKIVQYIMCV